MEYTVVTSKQLERLRKAVDKRMEAGWVPCGGIACATITATDTPKYWADNLWAQAMARDPMSKHFHENK